MTKYNWSGFRNTTLDWFLWPCGSSIMLSDETENLRHAWISGFAEINKSLFFERKFKLWYEIFKQFCRSLTTWLFIVRYIFYRMTMLNESSVEFEFQISAHTINVYRALHNWPAVLIYAISAFSAVEKRKKKMHLRQIECGHPCEFHLCCIRCL